MEALILLIPLSVLAVGVAVMLFFRMNASGQFDDDQGPAYSVLMDDDLPPVADEQTPDSTSPDAVPHEDAERVAFTTVVPHGVSSR